MIRTLIAAYRDDPEQLERVVDDALQLGPAYLIADPDDVNDKLLARISKPGVVFRAASYSRERDKRNALLDLAFLDGCGDNDWLLTLDADEKLLNGDALPLLLGRTPAHQPFYPLLRIEPKGTLWEMPCKLFRGAGARYSYLDIGVRFHGLGHWNLDPQPVRGFPVPGWPLISHYGSPRAATSSDFYSEALPISFEHRYSEWRKTNDAPGILAAG